MTSNAVKNSDFDKAVSFYEGNTKVADHKKSFQKDNLNFSGWSLGPLVSFLTEPRNLLRPRMFYKTLFPTKRLHFAKRTEK